MLLILTLVLCVPVRYKIIVEKKDELQVKLQFSWLLHMFCFKFQYIEKKMLYRLKFLFFSIIDSNKPKKRKKKTKKIKKQTKKNKKLNADKNAKEKDNSEIKEKSESKDKFETEEESDAKDKSEIEESSCIEDQSEINKESNNKDYSSREAQCTKEDESSSGELKSSISFFKRMKNKIQQIITKIRHIYQKVKQFIDSIPKKIEHIKELLNNISSVKSKVKAFINDETNRLVIGSIFKQIKGLFHHVRPRKLKADVVVGTGDPCSTGQLLGVLSIINCIYDRTIHITPDFQEKRYEGIIIASGRIRLGKAVNITMSLLKDKGFRSFLTSIKNEKEKK